MYCFVSTVHLFAIQSDQIIYKYEMWNYLKLITKILKLKTSVIIEKLMKCLNFCASCDPLSFLLPFPSFPSFYFQPLFPYIKIGAILTQSLISFLSCIWWLKYEFIIIMHFILLQNSYNDRKILEITCISYILIQSHYIKLMLKTLLKLTNLRDQNVKIILLKEIV